MTDRICSVADCGKRHDARGYCKTHYQRLMLHGDPLAAVRRRSSNGEAWAYYRAEVYRVTDECKIWPYGTMNGYGYVRATDQRSWGVHHLACRAWYGPQPLNMEAAHGPCHNRLCFNGAHLRWATGGENRADMNRDGSPYVKLSPEEVLQIRKDWASRQVTQGTLADVYGVTTTTIRQVIAGKTWKHLLTAAELLTPADQLRQRRPPRRLLAEEVLQIRAKVANEAMRPRDVAELYGVTPGTIYHIINGTNWKHLLTQSTGKR